MQPIAYEQADDVKDVRKERRSRKSHPRRTLLISSRLFHPSEPASQGKTDQLNYGIRLGRLPYPLLPYYCLFPLHPIRLPLNYLGSSSRPCFRPVAEWMRTIYSIYAFNIASADLGWSLPGQFGPIDIQTYIMTSSDLRSYCLDITCISRYMTSRLSLQYTSPLTSRRRRIHPSGCLSRLRMLISAKIIPLTGFGLLFELLPSESDQ